MGIGHLSSCRFYQKRLMFSRGNGKEWNERGNEVGM